jgi:hypothetical protein
MDNNIETPPVTRSTTPAARVTMFPRPIVDRAGDFSYPPKVGTRRRPSFSFGSSSTVVTTPRPQALAIPPPQGVAAPPPQAVAPLPETPVKFITHTFLVVPEGTRWSPIGVPTITHWPEHPESVVVSLPETKRWAGVNYPTSFPQDSVEWHVAEVFGRLPRYQNVEYTYPHVTGSFFKRTRKRKGVGQDRAYRLEKYTQDANALYGKLSANCVVVYLPSGSFPPSAGSNSLSAGSNGLSAGSADPSPGSVGPSANSPTTMQHTPSPALAHFQLAIPYQAQLASSSSQIGEPHEDLTDLEKLALSWERAHIAYYEAMDFKEKVNKREATSSSSSFFWSAFEDFCKEVVNNPNGDQQFCTICMDLMKRKKLRRGISICESKLSKIFQYMSISIYNETDFKIEFELHARRFWKQWNELDAATQSCLPCLEKDHARVFAQIHGGPNYMHNEPLTNANVKKFIDNNAFSKFTIQQIR